MITHDFTAGAVLMQEVSGSGVFSGVAEIGRASATVGTGNGGLVAKAWQLGAHMNGAVFRVGAPAAQAHVKLDPNLASGGAKTIHYTPLSGETSEESAAAFPALCHKAFSTRDAASALAHFRVGVHHLGNGSDPAVAGSVPFSGGLEPYNMHGAALMSEEDVDGGLICFDAPFTLVLGTFLFQLASSVAWELRLGRLDPDRSLAQYAVLGSGTAARGSVTLPAHIPPGSALSFVANTTGLVTATAHRLLR